MSHALARRRNLDHQRIVLERLPSHPPERLGELLPDVWPRAQRGGVEAMSMEIADQMAAPASGFP